MPLLNNFIWLAIAYLIGSVPTAYIVTQRVKGVDIRNHGSGNVGATNVFRVVGKQWGAAVLLIDLCKGLIVAVFLAATANALLTLSPPLRQFIFGCAAIAGHMWTPWLKLQGGKGIATACGVLVGIFPQAAAVSILIWAAVFMVKRYVSLASVAAAGSFPILLLFFHRRIESFGIVLTLAIVLAALLIFKHKANLERLRAGTEPRVEFGKKSTT